MRNVSQGQFFFYNSSCSCGRIYGSTSSCREYTYHRSDERSQPKGSIRGNTKIGQVLEVMVTKRCYGYGIEIKIGSVKKDGTRCCMVISRGVDKYVTELAADHTKPIHYDEASSSTGKLVAIKQRTEHLKASSFSSPALPIKQRNW